MFLGKQKRILIVYFIFVLIIVSFSILTLGQAYIQPDTATASLLVDSMIKNKQFFPSSWVYVNGDIWVINPQLFVFLPQIFIKNIPLARMLGSLLFVYSAIICIYFFDKKVLNSFSWVLAVSVLTVFLYGQNEFILFQAAYTGLILWIFGGLILFVKAYDGISGQIRYKDLVPILLYVLLMGISGLRILLEVAIPMIGTIVCYETGYLFITKYDKKRIKKCILFIALLLLSGIIGYSFFKSLCKSHYMIDSSSNKLVIEKSFVTILKNIKVYFGNYFECFGTNPDINIWWGEKCFDIFSKVICLLVCFIIPILQSLRIKTESFRIKIIYIFSLIHNVVMFLVIVLFNKTTPRYILSSIFILIVISANFVQKYWINSINRWSNIIILFIMFSSILGCISLVISGKNYKEVINEKRELSQTILNKGYTKGYASFGPACINSVYSDMKLRFGVVNVHSNTFYINKWLNDIDAYEIENTKSFLLLTSYEREIVEDNLDDILGRSVEECEISGLFFYGFDYDIADRISDGIDDGVLMPRELFVTENAVIKDDYIKLPYKEGTYGPYQYIKKGIYIVEINGTNLDGCEYHISSTTNDRINTEDISRNDKKIQIKLQINADLNDIEFCLSNMFEDNEVYISNITIDEM